MGENYKINGGGAWMAGGGAERAAEVAVMVGARVAAVVTWTYAACYGIPAVWVVWYVARHGTLPWFAGLFPVYGGPWWNRFGADAFSGALIAFFALSLVVAWSGWLMWRGSQFGGVANLGLLPVEAVFWWGFALPIPVVVGLVRLVLVGRWLAASRMNR